MCDCCVLVYADNHFGEEAGKALAEALKENSTVLHVDLSGEQGLRGRGAVQAHGAIRERSGAYTHWRLGLWHSTAAREGAVGEGLHMQGAPTRALAHLA